VIIKLKKILSEGYVWDRKFGEPLPTLEDVMKEAEVDDDTILKYKDKDGESQEMTAGAAKKMGKDHPAKQAWDNLADKGGEEEPKGKGLEPDDFERDSDDSEPKGDEEPDSKEKVSKMSRKELANFDDEPFSNDDDRTYLGSDDYDPEDDSFESPNLDGLEDMDKTTLKQKFMDLQAHKQKMEYDIEDADSQGDTDWEKESQDMRSTAVKNQNKILQLLKPQMPTTGMSGRSTRGGIGIRDSVEINGKKYKKVKEEKKITDKHSLREMFERISKK
jgi:hypothetical protein